MCYHLTSLDGQTVEVVSIDALFSSQEEADIILHCLHVRDTEPEDTTIVVRFPETDVLVLLMKFFNQIERHTLFDTGVGNKRRLLSVDDTVRHKGGCISAILPAVYFLTACDTSSSVRRGKVSLL